MKQDIKLLIQESLIESERICKNMNDREISVLSTKNDPVHLSKQRKDSTLIKSLLMHCAYLSQFKIQDIQEISQGKRLYYPIDQAFNSGKKGKELILEMAILLSNHIRSQIRLVEKLDDVNEDVCPNCTAPVSIQAEKCQNCHIYLNINRGFNDYDEKFLEGDL